MYFVFSFNPVRLRRGGGLCRLSFSRLNSFRKKKLKIYFEGLDWQYRQTSLAFFVRLTTLFQWIYVSLGCYRRTQGSCVLILLFEIQFDENHSNLVPPARKAITQQGNHGA